MNDKPRHRHGMLERFSETKLGKGVLLVIVLSILLQILNHWFDYWEM